MEIKLQLEGVELNQSMQEIFGSLSKKKKEDLALQIMREWLAEPNGLERKMYENKLVQRIRESEYSGRSDITDEQIRSSWKFRDEKQKFKSVKETMIENITNEAVKYFKEQAKQALESDEQIAGLREEVVETLKKLYPDIVKEAVIITAMQNFFHLQGQITQNTLQLSQQIPVVKSMLDKMNRGY